MKMQRAYSWRFAVAAIAILVSGMLLGWLANVVGFDLPKEWLPWSFVMLVVSAVCCEACRSKRVWLRVVGSVLWVATAPVVGLATMECDHSRTSRGVPSLELLVLLICNLLIIHTMIVLSRHITGRKIPKLLWTWPKPRLHPGGKDNMVRGYIGSRGVLLFLVIAGCVTIAAYVSPFAGTAQIAVVATSIYWIVFAGAILISDRTNFTGWWGGRRRRFLSFRRDIPQYFYPAEAKAKFVFTFMLTLATWALFLHWAVAVGCLVVGVVAYIKARTFFHKRSLRRLEEEK